jgi:putative transcriptional regulator
MQVSKHPDNEMLVDYAAGALGPAVCVSISSHLNFCQECRGKNSELSSLGGSFLETTAPAELSSGALNEVLARLDQVASPAASRQQVLQEDEARLPQLVKNLLPDHGVKWRFLTPALRISRLVVGEDHYELALHKIKAGGKAPDHGHNGLEITVVLQGSFSDSDGVYHEGDFLVRQPGDVHSPTASANDSCICLSVSEAPIKLVGPIKRLLNPLFSITPQ